MKLLIDKRDFYLDKTEIMGILNVTPDSFFDGGCYYTVSKAIDHVNYMVTHGATFIDIGGESTRPEAMPISEEEELERVIPVVHAVSKRFNIFISVNTSSALVIQESMLAGAHLINDVRSLMSQEVMQSAACSTLSVCLVHMQGNPQTMQDFPQYCDVLKSIDKYFVEQILRCELAGISRNKLLIDPGFGFGKNLQHNYQLLANLKHFHHFKLPILVGISRKSMLSNCRYKKCSGVNIASLSPQQRLIGSITCAVIAAMQGVHIVRVHDVKETAEALYVVESMFAQQKNKNKKDNSRDETS